MSDRSEQALRERLELAKKATDGPWKESVQIVNGDAVSAVSTACGDEICNTYGNLLCDTFDAAHIAANHPEVVRADLEEILVLRAEVARLQKKIEELEETAERDDIDGQIVLGEAEKLAKALADNGICAYNVDDDGIAGAQEECSRLNCCRECWRAYAHEKVMAEMESEEE